MRVAEVKPGMTGYGLSVFQGTKVERFEVEVISVLKNFNPKHDVVLIRCRGANLEHTGPISGMSGSPIYLKDERGRERLIGAFAYGWSLAKDAVVGVQPIEYMLRLPESARDATAGNAKADTDGGAGSIDASRVAPSAGRRVRWALSDSVLLPGMAEAPRSYPLASLTSFNPNPKAFNSAGDANTMRLQPLVTPLLASGVPSKLIDDFEPLFRAYGLMPLQAGGGGGGSTASRGDLPAAPLEPGSVLAAPLLQGDVELTAVGTCTELVGDYFVGFGHSFNNEGKVELPVASGEISAVVAKLDHSFKIGAATQLRGTIRNDQVSGVGGKLGAVPAGIPIDLRVRYADGSQDSAYHFTAALHPRFTPLIAAMALNAAVTGRRELPQYHTVDYELSLDFTNGRTVNVTNRAVNIPPALLFTELALPMIAASENPFERVPVKSIRGTITVAPEARQAQVLSVNVPKLKYRPGERIKGYVTYRPFRAAETIMPFEIDLPRDLPDGPYQLVVSDWQRYLGDEAQSRPFRFTAESADEVFDVVRDFTSIRHNAVYVRLLRRPDGVAVGRVAMPRLPSSRRQVLLGAGRSDTTQFVSSTVQVLPTEHVMEGSAEFVITIDNDANVEVGTAPAAAPAKKETKESKSEPAAPGASKSDASKDDKSAAEPPADPAPR